MPSPIAHLAVGYALYRLFRRREPEPTLKPIGPVPGLLAVTAAFSILPDIDSVVGLLAGNFGRFHNNATHSLFVGVAFSLGFAALMWVLGGKSRREQFAYWFGVAVVSYSLHIIMDAATISRGVMAFWPLTSERFLAPVTIFYGLHWSDGWVSIRHLWTFLTESAFAGLVLFALYRFDRPQEESS
jgi:inner membrane protein